MSTIWKSDHPTSVYAIHCLIPNSESHTDLVSPSLCCPPIFWSALMVMPKSVSTPFIFETHHHISHTLRGSFLFLFHSSWAKPEPVLVTATIDKGLFPLRRCLFKLSHELSLVAKSFTQRTLKLSAANLLCVRGNLSSGHEQLSFICICWILPVREILSGCFSVTNFFIVLLPQI